MLVQADSDFYLINSRSPFATYKVLWYQRGRGQWHYNVGQRCKVDILVPGIMNIPAVPSQRVETLSGLPVMPLLPHLCLKLQAWDDHGKSYRSDMRVKQHVDVRDVNRLLEIAVVRRVSVRGQDAAWVPTAMVTEATKRAKRYVSGSLGVLGSLESAANWRAIGFLV